MKLVEILDAIKAENGIGSNGELARFLGTDVRRIGEYYAGKRTPIDEDYPRIAEKAHMTAGQLWEAVQIEKKKDSEAARVWENYMKRLGGIAAYVLITLCVTVTMLVTLTPGNASAATVSGGKTLYYVK